MLFSFAILSLINVVGCIWIAFVSLNLVETTEFRFEGSKLYMRGEIYAKTLEQLEDIYAWDPGISTLVETDIPGLLDGDTMIEFGYRIRELGLNMHLTPDSEINSGGVDLFLAGARWTMEPGAHIGVHA
ncbi:hypothetical protein [Ruegeria sp. EL01]|jgi:hypothetical protein|uniref:hypothetical protein n=1 Tax=Ruegeria sp. EL01 TaxID=2107578 RepID=UPI000EA81C0D|nr:hypothetical protein [Ruegeria sp. EL01]